LARIGKLLMAVYEFIRGDAHSRVNSRETANGNVENLPTIDTFNLRIKYRNGINTPLESR
jgi:hypothetical protein